MKRFEVRDIRNVVLVGHQGCGKTSLAEAIIFDAGGTNRLGSVSSESSNFDTEPEEIKRKSSTCAGFASVEWKKTKINVIDTPGDSNFFTDTRNCITAADAAVIVVSAVDGVQVQTERGWGLTSDQGTPRLVFFSKMDRERADFEQVLKASRGALSEKIVPLQIPIGKEDSFKGVVDLLSGKALVWTADGSGAHQTTDVPADLAGPAKAAREALVDAVAASDDALTEKYLENGDLTADEIVTGLRKAIAAGTFIPALCGSATRNVGSQPLLDLLVSSYPSPADRGPRTGKSLTDDSEETRAPDPEAPFSAQVFKTVVDQFTGKISVFRIWSGTLKPDSGFLNTTRDSKERFNQLLLVQGKKQESIGDAVAGDIVAVAKLKETATGDSLADEKAPILYEPLPPSPPVITFALRSKSKGDEDKIGMALARILEEDPTIVVTRDAEAKEVLISGMGQLHVEITVDKMKRKFGVDVELNAPKVPYRETIKGRTMNVEGKHKKQTGGRGQFGVCYINLEPGPRGSGFVFEDGIVGGSIPRQFIPSVEKGIRSALSRGIIAGYLVVDIKVTLFDGKYHDVDSSDMSFQMAGSKGIKAAFKQSKPTLLEPIWNLEVQTPDDKMGDVIGDINSKRGRVLGVEAKGKGQSIKALVPMAELLRYETELRSMTGGRGAFSTSFSHYDEVPSHLHEKIIADFKDAEDDD